MAGLRIEIERRLQRLAEARGMMDRFPMGVSRLISSLARSRALANEQALVLHDLIPLLNKAAHGASVDENGAEWAIDVGPRILAGLDELLES